MNDNNLYQEDMEENAGIVDFNSWSTFFAETNDVNAAIVLEPTIVGYMAAPVAVYHKKSYAAKTMVISIDAFKEFLVESNRKILLYQLKPIDVIQHWPKSTNTHKIRFIEVE